MAIRGPLTVAPGYRLLSHAGLCEPTRTRRSCCLAWRTGDAATCFACPRTSDAERRARMQSWPDAVTGVSREARG